MDTRDVLIIGAGIAALLFLSKRSYAQTWAYNENRDTATPPYWWDTSTLAPTLDYTSTVADVEDAEIFQSSFPGYQETITPVDDEWLDYPGDSQGALMQTGTGNRNLDAFLRLLRRLEVGTDGPEGYARVHDAVARKIGQQYLTDLTDHPRVRVPYGGTTTSAAGAYQFQMGTWDNVARALALPDFKPDSQDKAAVYLITGRGALNDIIAGKLKSAVAKLKREWSSLPAGAEAQLDLDGLNRMFLSYGGTLDPVEGGTAYA